MDNMTIAEAFEFIDEGNFKKAGLICLDIVRKEPENAAVYVAMLMIEMQARNANQIKANLHMYADSDNYKNAVKYDNGEFSELLKIDKKKAKKIAKNKKKGITAVVVLVLLVIAIVLGYVYLMPAVNYYRADKSLENKDYLKASDIFASLGDYKDSSEKFEDSIVKYATTFYNAGDISGCLYELEKVENGSSEELKKLRYDCAMSEMNSMAYTEAAYAFELLGDYKDSEQKMYNCYLYYACNLSDSGDREGTLKALEKIGLYEDEIPDMKYSHGSFLFDHQMYYDAKLHYAMLGDYRDCVEKVVYIDSVAGETQYTVTDNPGDEEATVGVFTDYKEAFESLSENDECHIYDELGIMYY